MPLTPCDSMFTNEIGERGGRCGRTAFCWLRSWPRPRRAVAATTPKAAESAVPQARAAREPVAAPARAAARARVVLPAAQARVAAQGPRAKVVLPAAPDPA